MGTSENSSNNEVYTFSVTHIDINGNVNIKIQKLSEETSTIVIDNIAWETMPKLIIPVSGLSLSKTELEIEQYTTEKLVANITPDNVTDLNITWSSDNPNIVKVDTNGLLTAMSAGKAVITAIATPGNKSVTCTVTVAKAVNATYTETFNNISYSGWGTETYIGDNGYKWSVNGNAGNHINSTTGLYAKNSMIASSDIIPGGISSFSVTCKNMWSNGLEATIELLVNGKVVGSSKTTSSGTEYTFSVTDINISGDVTISLRTGSEKIAVDNITWTTYKQSTKSLPEAKETSDFIVYPNPFTHKLTIETNGEFETATLLNINAKVLEVKKFNGNKIISLTPKHPLTSGTYLLKLVENNKTAVYKVFCN
ncbi:Ig-like domain-containing protein [Bacteroidales bacterium]|nr:Ig-like domain-containing protein [Bacteroidales bacterium]